MTLVFLIAAAITRGAILMTATHTVGPVRAANGPITWRCLDIGATPVDAWQVSKVAFETPWGIDTEDHYEPDTSAFGAATAFVKAVGERAARAALARLTRTLLHLDSPALQPA